MKKYSNLAYVLGNGKSRLQYDLKELTGEGVTVGCNAIYRDEICDYVVATDCHITAEIVSSGYSRKHKCYFRDRIHHPAEYKSLLTLGMNRVTDYHRDEPYIVAIGLTDIDETITAGESELLIFGLYEDDLSKDLKEAGCDMHNKETMEFAGSNAIDLACRIDDGKYYVIMLIGFDFAATDGMVNNVYTGTTSYMQHGSVENAKMQQSVDEIDRVIKENPTKSFVMSHPNPPEKLCKNYNFLACSDLLNDRERWLNNLKNFEEKP